MSNWWIIGIGLGVLAIGIISAVMLSRRRSAAADLAVTLAALRARTEGLTFQLDAREADPALGPVAGEDAAEARRLLATAQASLSSARHHRSPAAAAEVSRTLELAEARINRVGQ